MGCKREGSQPGSLQSLELCQEFRMMNQVSQQLFCTHHVYNSRFMSVLYSKKVADEYPWTQAVPNDPHSVSPIP